MTDQTDKHEAATKSRYLVTLDLTDADASFAVTEALREFASRQRWEAKEDPDGNAASRVRWAEAAEEALERAENPQPFTDAERDIIARARELGPALRASGSDRDRLAGWLLKELADLAARHAVPTLEAGQ